MLLQKGEHRVTAVSLYSGTAALLRFVAPSLVVGVFQTHLLVYPSEKEQGKPYFAAFIRFIIFRTSKSRAFLRARLISLIA